VKDIPYFEELSPMQQLMVEVLLARYRLGESSYIFRNGSSMSRAFTGLEENGWIKSCNSIVPGWLGAALTGAAIEKLDAENPNPATKLGKIHMNDLNTMTELPPELFANARIKEVRIKFL